MSSGRRARKTLIGGRKIFKRAIRKKESRYFQGAPTFNQAKAIFWDKLIKMSNGWRKCEPNRSALYVTLINEAEIHVIGMDKPQRIEGQPWDGCHLTEFADFKKDAWQSNIRPVLADTNGTAILDGVPEMGASWHKDLARYSCGGSFPITEPFHGAYKENSDNPDWCFYSWFSEDVLPQKEIVELKRTTDEKIFNQEYRGSYETLGGQVYYGFNADYYPYGNLDKDIEYDKDQPIFMGFDFNVNPMTAVLGHVRTANSGKLKGLEQWLLFKGYFIENSNTKTLAERIVADFPDTYRFILTPCQSSSNRQTVADIGVTDIRVIKSVFKEAGRRLEIYKRSKNPLVKNRVMSSNSMWGTRRLRINPNDPGLKFLQKDCEGLQYKQGTSDIDLTTDVMMGHISAACDYGCERRWPIKHVVDKSVLDNYDF